MGEREAGVSERTALPAEDEEARARSRAERRGRNGGDTGADEPDEIEEEIDSLRADIDRLVSELDRRRHAALDWRAQLSRHAGKLAIAGGAVVVLVAVRISARRRRQDPVHKLAELATGLRMIARDPERLVSGLEGRRQADPLAFARAAALTAGGILARQWFTRVVERQARRMG